MSLNKARSVKAWHLARYLMPEESGEEAFFTTAALQVLCQILEVLFASGQELMLDDLARSAGSPEREGGVAAPPEPGLPLGLLGDQRTAADILAAVRASIAGQKFGLGPRLV